MDLDKKDAEAGDEISDGQFDPIPSGAYQTIQSLYDAGLCLQAYESTKPFGELKRWKGAKARTLAARLASNLGAGRLSSVLSWLAWRSSKSDPDLAAYHAHTIMGRRGPLATLDFLGRFSPGAESADRDGVMHYYTVHAMAAAQLRDFTTSEASLDRARTTAPDHPWIDVVESRVAETQDRYSEALQFARRSLERRPWYRPGLQAVSHLLQLLDRPREALELLTEAVERIENYHVMRQLSALQQEFRLYSDAAASLQRMSELCPMAEKDERSWLIRELIGLDCLRGEFESARIRIQQIRNEPYYDELAARLADGTQRRRVHLDVPFIRQHHLTCAPATLAAISRFWKKPAEHLEIAEAICYDGSPAHSERHWSETHGWVVREFTVTWESAVKLLERGIPFTLTTSETTSAHLQAVVGYDELRQTLWIRDPFIYNTCEFVARNLFDRYRSTGPRGMALVPENQRALLDDLSLPDADLYDGLHAVQRALSLHHRADAVRACEQMQASAPDHRLTLTARRAIAAYDGNTPAMLDCIEQLLKQFPNDGNLNLVRLSCLDDLTQRDERLRMLEQLCSKRETDPVFWQRYAQELRADARQNRTAATWLRWAMRYRWTDPSLMAAWADYLSDEREFEQATKYYRLAACLGDKRESFCHSYFNALRRLRGTDTALDFLRQRNERLGSLSSAPATTLVEALRSIDRPHHATQYLEAALGRRPDDGSLLLFAADFYGQLGKFETAEAWLAKARECSAPVAWHRSAASIAGYRLDKSAALNHWREVLKLEPLAHDGIRAITALLAETEGREHAMRFLGEMCERFPFSCPLLALRIQWVKEDGAEAVIPHVRRLLTVNPADAWAWRELALQLSVTRDCAGALEAAREGVRLDPKNSAGYSVRADILIQNGNLAEARADYREALRLEVDNEYALLRYVETGATLAERKEALDFVAMELRRQVIFHNALEAYQRAARGLLPADEVLELLREAHVARADLWQAWSVLINQLVDTGRHVDALNIAQIATARFPLLPRLWVDLARVEHARLNAAGEINALEKALELNPGYSFASRQLAGVFERQLELVKARAVMEQAIAASPLDAENQIHLAHLLWKLNERDAAIARVQQVLRQQPGFTWAWNSLRAWGSETGKPGLAADMARDLTRIRPGEARSWLMLARSLHPRSDADEIFAALDRAAALNPDLDESHDLRAKALAELNRFDEALAVCNDSPIKPVPATLRIRAAWIEIQRGNLQMAIATAKSALEEHPNHYGGWQLIADCHERAGQLEDAAKAAEHMAALAPLEPVPLGYLGDVKLRLGDDASAESAFDRAFTLDPDYTFAGFNLFDLQLKRRDFAGAGKTLQRLQHGGETPATLCCAVDLACKTGRAEDAMFLFQQLCVKPDCELWMIQRLITAFEGIGRRRTAVKMIRRTVSRPDCPPAIVEFWVASETSANNWNLHSKLKAMKGDTQRRAVLQYLDQLGEAFQKFGSGILMSGGHRFHFWRILRRHRHWLFNDVAGWGKVGYVLACIGRPKPAVEWLGDWKNRPNAESWMLHNLVLMLRELRRYDEAREVIRHAVTLRHETELYEMFRLSAAFEEALAGDPSSAEKHLSKLSDQNLQDHHRPVLSLTRLLIRFQQELASSCDSLGSIARMELKKIFSSVPPAEAGHYARDAYRRFTSHIASRAGGWKFRVWSGWFYRGPNNYVILGSFILVPVSIVAAAKFDMVLLAFAPFLLIAVIAGLMSKRLNF